jgi:hypothetical protein
LEAFRQQLAGDERATLTLSRDDLNLAIAAFEPLRDLRGKLSVISADGGVLRLAVSFPLNGKPRLARADEKGWISSDARYLNGTLVACPALMKGEVILLLDAIEVPSATVPKEFIEQMSPYRIAERYLTDQAIGPAMAKLTQLKVENGQLTVERVPGESPPTDFTPDQVDSASHRLFKVLGFVACAFLVFAGLIVFFGLRAKAAKASGEASDG